MRGRGIYIALAIFVGAFILFYIFDLRRGAPGPQATPSPAASPILSLSASQVEKVVVKAKGKVVTLSRAGTDWTYSDCAADQQTCTSQPADTSRSVSVAATLARLVPNHIVYGAPEGLPAYGLNKATTAEVDVTALNRTSVLLVGAKTQDGSFYYVRRSDGNDIYTIATSIVDGMVALVDTPPVPIASPSPASSASP